MINFHIFWILQEKIENFSKISNYQIFSIFQFLSKSQNNNKITNFSKTIKIDRSSLFLIFVHINKSHGNLSFKLNFYLFLWFNIWFRIFLFNLRVLSMSIFPIILSLFRIMGVFHGWLSWLPISWTNITMFSMKLTSLDKSKNVSHISSYGKLVHLVTAKFLFWVDDISSSQSDSFIVSWGDQAIVCFGNVLRKVREKWKFQRANSTIF